MKMKTLFVAMAITAAFCTSAMAATKINLNSQPNDAGFPMWLAKKLGYFKDNGIDAKITYFPNGGAALASGVSGDWQAGWTGAPPAISGWDKFQLISVGTMQKEDRNIKLIVRNDALKGGKIAEVLTKVKIGTVPNSTWSQVLYACADHFGVSHDALKIVPLDPPVTRQSLRSGEIGAGMTDAAPDYDFVHDPKTYTVVCDGKIAGTSVVDPYIVTSRFWKEKPKAAIGFIEAVYRADQYMHDNPQKFLDYVTQYYKETGIDLTRKQAAYSYSLRDFQTLDQALSDMESGKTIKDLTTTAKVLVGAGAYDAVPDFSAMQPISLEILKAAKKLRDSR
jgi:ABC-type nitrate/sulfonate/bicarbonate transport system substrate-binding protein